MGKSYDGHLTHIHIHVDFSVYMIFIRLSKTGCIMPCPSSVCLSVSKSVNFSCVLNNSDTVQTFS